MIIFMFLGVSIYWFYFWFVEYTRIQQCEIWERLGRTFGHMSNFAMGFLLFPVARFPFPMKVNWKSLEIPFGILCLALLLKKQLLFIDCWDFSRYFSYKEVSKSQFVCWTLHLLCWVVKWYLIGHLSNLITIFNYPHAGIFNLCNIWSPTRQLDYSHDVLGHVASCPRDGVSRIWEISEKTLWVVFLHTSSLFSLFCHDFDTRMESGNESWHFDNLCSGIISSPDFFCILLIDSLVSTFLVKMSKSLTYVTALGVTCDLNLKLTTCSIDLDNIVS